VQGAVLSFAALCALGVALALLYRLGRRAAAAAMGDAP